MAEVSFKSVS